jgi:hypothetical protein
MCGTHNPFIATSARAMFGIRWRTSAKGDPFSAIGRLSELATAWPKRWIGTF